MANHDDLDLVALFGLSREEANGLGLDAAGQPPADEAAGHPRNERPTPTAGPISTPPAAPGDDLAFLRLFDGRDEPAPRDEEHRGRNAPPGLSLAAAQAVPVPQPEQARDDRVGDEDESKNVAATATEDAYRFTILPTASDDNADSPGDLDVAHLFGLSTEEALGLGLSSLASGETQAQPIDPPVPEPFDVVTSEPRLVAFDVVTPEPRLVAFPTMHLHALDGELSAELAASLGPVDDRVVEAPLPVDSHVPAQDEPAAQTQDELADVPSDTTSSAPAGSATIADEVSAPVAVDADAVPSPLAWHDSGSAESSSNMQADAASVPWTAVTPMSAAGAEASDGDAPPAEPAAPDVDPALLEAFGEESSELLDGLHIELERLEKAPDDRGALLETRRIVHTLKGGAKMCAFEHVATLTHSCENLLDLAAESTVPLDAAVLHALFACEPVLRGAVQDALAGNATAIEDVDTFCTLFDNLCAHGSAQGGQDQPGALPARISPAPPEPITPDEPASPATTGAADGMLAQRPAIAPGIVPPAASIGFARLDDPAPAAPRPAGRRSANSINVDLAKVDTLVAKLTEIATHRVSYQAMTGQLLETAEEARRNVTRLQTLALQIGNACATIQPDEAPALDDDLDLERYTQLNTFVLQLNEAVSDQQALLQSIYDTITTHWRLRATESRVDADIQSALMNIRLIPIASLRVRLDGVVRQAAEATGKSVRWQLHGGNVAVEKNVFDRLFEPLMHLLRNAIDHGLETPEARRDAGKAETGSLAVSAQQEGNHIVIAVSDDGRGIVPNRIAALAVERGLVTAEQANALTPQQKTGLIFTPGFSTAGTVSHLSGRGVGMDVVRESCLRMGGTVDVSSRPGLGTTITMRLPLSLSVTRGLTVRDGGRVMVLPVSQIQALHLVQASDVAETPRGRIARLEGLELPIYNLPPLPGAVPTGYVQNGEVNVLQVQHDGGSIGLVIEDVLDEEEILIKAPPALLRPVKALLGAHVMPDGVVAPVINLPQMLADLRPVAALTPEAEGAAAQELSALVVDDSMSMRVALTGTLQSAGFKVLTARDGQEALDVLKREGLPSLVTLDVEMPRMDGLETLYAIRQMPGAHELPVFIMTSRGGAKHRRAAEQLGATRYFTKPYRDSELATAARAACPGAISA